MALNCCRLTQSGLRAITDALSRLGIDCDNMSALSERTGIHRQTLTKMLPPSPGIVQSKTIESFFNWLDKELSDRFSEPLRLEDSYFEEVSTQVSRSLRAASTKNTQASAIQTTRTHRTSTASSSLKQEVASLLCLLNYRQQADQFKDSIFRLKPASAFLVQASDRRIRYWLVNRLAREIPNFTNAVKLDVSVKTFWTVDRLWAELARQLKLDSHPSTLQQTVLKTLCKQCQQETIVLGLYEAHKLDSETAASLICDFWAPLAEELSSQSCSPRSQFVLFLAGESIKTSIESAKRLIPLTFPNLLERHDIEGWLIEDRVCSLLMPQLGQDNYNELIQKKLPDWRLEPLAVIDYICDVFDLDGGIADVERYWKLAQDEQTTKAKL